jgi:hypothetical protein
MAFNIKNTSGSQTADAQKNITDLDKLFNPSSASVVVKAKSKNLIAQSSVTDEKFYASSFYNSGFIIHRESYDVRKIGVHDVGNFNDGQSLIKALADQVDKRKLKGMSPANLKYIVISAHGYPGSIRFANGNSVPINALVRDLFVAGVIKKGSTIEFASCFVGQDLNSIKKIAKELGVTIIASNDITTNQLGASYLTQLGGYIFNLYENKKVPINTGELTFHPDGRVTQDKKEITSVEVHDGNARPKPQPGPSRGSRRR